MTCSECVFYFVIFVSGCLSGAMLIVGVRGFSGNKVETEEKKYVCTYLPYERLFCGKPIDVLTEILSSMRRELQSYKLLEHEITTRIRPYSQGIEITLSAEVG